MMNIDSMNSELEKIRGLMAQATRESEAFTKAIERLDDGSRDKQWLDQKTAEHRAAFVPKIQAVMDLVGEIGAGVLKHEKFWASKELIMSTRPITKSVNNHPFGAAEDEGVESIARVAKMGEYSKMSNEMLHLHGEMAKAKGQHGLLHLIVLENSTRDTQGPGWAAIDLSDVILPDQQQALALLNEAKTSQIAMLYMSRQASGGTVSPADRITLARQEALYADV